MKELARIFFAIPLIFLVADCVCREEPWVGKAKVSQIADVPCFGLPGEKVSDKERTRISLILMSEGKHELWRYDEDEYAKMGFAANACTPYKADIYNVEDVRKTDELKSGIFYELLVKNGTG